MELEISLTPTSALYYELDKGPLRVMTPSATESNRTASLQIRATRKKAITAEGKEKELSPAFVFQARMLAGGVESMAYGPKCKVKEPVAESAKKEAAVPTK